MRQTATAVVRVSGSTMLTREARFEGGRLTSHGAWPPAIPGSLSGTRCRPIAGLMNNPG